MRSEKAEVLKRLGWTDELLRMTEPTPSSKALENVLMNQVQQALEVAGIDVLEYVATYPRASSNDLARKLSQETQTKLSGVGFVMAVYNHAARLGKVRELARELLIRKILNAFPSGWKGKSDIHPAVRIGSWVDEIEKSCDEKSTGCASEILRDLAVDHPPPEGWLPNQACDPLIDEVFARFWPVAQKP